MYDRMEGTMRVHKVTRVWEIAKALRLTSADVMPVLRLLGYPVRSASSRLDLEPHERAALIVTVGAHA